MIRVVFRTSPVSTGQTAVSMLTHAAGSDLEALLTMLNSNPTVTAITIHKTLTVPNLPLTGQLTAADLGLKHLEKIQ